MAKNKERKIIVLGAGASIGAKRYPIDSSLSEMMNQMPSAENFFYDLFKTNKTDSRPAGFLNTLGLTFSNLNDLITRAWGINLEHFDPEEWKGVNIEEVMTFLEVGSRMYPVNSDYQKVFKIAQEQLLAYMHPLIPMRCEGQHCEYLANIFFSLKESDTVISYNWDTISDFTLAHLKAPQLKNYARLLRDKDIKTEKYKDLGLLLKLHGSFNWYCCEGKKCEFSKQPRPPFQKNRSILLNSRQLWKCPSCGNDRPKPLIVPPVSNKLINKNAFIKKLWLIAREQLTNVTDITFIGYSFPPTDFYTEWLFRQLNFIVDRPEIKITIVNPEYRKRGSAVTKRYNNLFRDYEIESYKTLKQYSEENLFV